MDAPAYLPFHDSGELERRAEALRDTARACALCPRRCGVDRTAGETGFCRAGERASGLERPSSRSIRPDELGIAEAADGVGTVGLASRPQVASSEPTEDGRPTCMGSLTLERVEDLFDGVTHDRACTVAG